MYTVGLVSEVRGVKTFCMKRLWLEWRKTAGHRLPETSRSQARAKLMAMATRVKQVIQYQVGVTQPA